MSAFAVSTLRWLHVASIGSVMLAAVDTSSAHTAVSHAVAETLTPQALGDFSVYRVVPFPSNCAVIVGPHLLKFLQGSRSFYKVHKVRLVPVFSRRVTSRDFVDGERDESVFLQVQFQLFSVHVLQATEHHFQWPCCRVVVGVVLNPWFHQVLQSSMVASF